MDIKTLLRDNIKNLIPYSSARDEFKGNAHIYLDANENSFGSPIPGEYNRYPDPLQKELKEKLSRIKGTPAKNIFLGNGSDEAIDILFRAFCRPKVDNVILLHPSYGMYEVAANINDVGIRKVYLTSDFQPDLNAILSSIDSYSKLLFICSPNNPTGNAFSGEAIQFILDQFQGLVIIDEAYINYSGQASFIKELIRYENLVVLQTLSKAWGLAALRLGMAFAGEAIIEVMNKIKPPYNINLASQQLAIQALDHISLVNRQIQETVFEREQLRKKLSLIPIVEKVYPSDANFILVKVKDADALYLYLIQHGIITRNRSRVALCENCLRITIGVVQENEMLLKTIYSFVERIGRINDESLDSEINP